MGSGFGGGASGSLFGATGSANFLSRATAVLADDVLHRSSLGARVRRDATSRRERGGGVIDATQQADAAGAAAEAPKPGAETQAPADAQKPAQSAEAAAPASERRSAAVIRSDIFRG